VQTALAIANLIDRLNHRIGRGAAWLTLAMVLIGSYNAIVRYVGRHFQLDLSSNAYLELQWYLFSMVFLLGAAYTLRHHEHVRIDILFSRFSQRTQAIINLTGHIIFLLPFCAVILWLSWAPVSNSWAIREMSPDPGGLPRYPIKALIPLAFLLLLLQGISDTIKQIAFLRGQLAPEEEDLRKGEL
jgi:TRAP-type mannitol/chloroaromatic compound transport system permease small subunit